MKQQILLILVLGLSSLVYSQDPDEILAEGKLLYRLEKASWYATDDFMARFPEKMAFIRGYLSYEGEDHHIYTIFLGGEGGDSVMLRYRFDSIPEFPLYIDTATTEAKSCEEDLIAIRQDAAERITINEDNFFTFYKNTSFNLIPLITEKERKVFILTGPQLANMVIIGNDSGLDYDKHKRFKGKMQLHKSLLQYPYRSDDPEDKLKTTMHSHIVTEYITSTDICTLLLYRDFVEWKQHYVISKDYVSIFDMEKETLVTMTKKAWDRMNSSRSGKE